MDQHTHLTCWLIETPLSPSKGYIAQRHERFQNLFKSNTAIHTLMYNQVMYQKKNSTVVKVTFPHVIESKSALFFHSTVKGVN